MLNLLNNMKSYLRNEKGQGMVEYALIIAFVAIVVIGAVTLFGTQIQTIFTNITSGLGGGAAQ